MEARKTSVRNALLLAKLLLTQERIRITDAAQHLGVAPSTAHRLLAALAKREYAQRNPDRTYSVGRVLQRPSDRHELHGKVKSVARRYLEDLADRTNETVNLQVMEHDEIRFILCVEARRSNRVGDRTGHALPLFTSAAGRSILAHPKSAAVLAEIAAHRTGDHDLGKFMNELESIRAKGYTVNKDQTQLGVTAISKALLASPDMVMAISVAIPTFRYDPESNIYFLREMEKTCGLIEEAHKENGDDQ